MSYEGKVHFVAFDGRLPFCGHPCWSGSFSYTTNPRQVTCKRCHRAMVFRGVIPR